MIINFKNDGGYDLIVNTSNMLYSQVSVNGGYVIFFGERQQLSLSWKEHDRFVKAIEQHGAE